MKRRNATRSALFTSIISLLLCVSMLVGTTFAWFTDSVVSGNNVIAAGNLDVEVFNALGIDESKKVTTNTQLFDEITYWEPGVVAFENITVANMGSLALKYQLSVNFDNATENANGDTLAKVLKVGFVEGGITSTTREGALTEVNSWQALESFVQPGALDAVNKDLTAASTSDTYGIVIYWEPSTIDNEFNMNNENKGKVMSINLGIALVATQLEAELDSFGSDYDKDAVYGDHYATDAFELQNALDNAEEGEVIVLMEDIDLSGNSKARAATDDFALTVPAGKNVILNLNGNTISRTSSVSDINGDGAYTSADNQGIFRVKGVMTVVGQGTIAMQNTGGNMEWNALSACFSIEGGDLTLGEGVTVIHRGGTDMAYAVDVNTSGAPSTLTVDGAILSSSYTAVRLFNFSNHLATVNVNSGVISGAKRDIWKQSTGANSVNIAVPYTEENGIYTIGDANVSVPSNSATLKTAVAAAGATVNVPAGEYTFPSSFAEGVTLNCDEDTVFTGTSSLNINGATVVGATFSNPTDTVVSGTINGIFKDCVFEGKNGLRWCYTGETVVFEDCVFSGDTYGVHFDGGAKQVVFKNCTFSGFNAIAGSIEVAKYEDCTFVANGKSNYNGINMWGNTEMTNCTFVFDGTAGNEWIDLCGENKTATFENCVVTNGSETTNIAGVVSKRNDNATIIIDGAAVVNTGASLQNALANDQNIVMTEDITFTGEKTADRNNYVEAYGNKVGFAQYGGVLDGNGKTLTDSEGDKSYVVVTHGGTIKNLTIKTGARGIVTYAPTANVYIDNVIVDGPGYALNSTEHGAVDMFVTNSTINGWTSLAGFKSVNFTNCKLGENTAKYWQGMGYGQDYDRLFRVYSATTYTKCEFEQGYYLDMSTGGTATLIDCTVNGVEITVENYADYITIELPAGKTLADCVTFG